MTERFHFHFSLSCIGEGNGNPLQYSCLENPRDGRAWWAAVYGVAQSRTRLKRLSISISIEFRKMVTMTLYVRWQKRHRCKEQTFGLCGRRQGWDDLRDNIETCILPYMKYITIPGSMHKTGHSGQVHWDDPEG